MAKTDRIYIRVTPELKEKLAELAAAENRTVSNYIENLIYNAIENKKREG